MTGAEVLTLRRSHAREEARELLGRASSRIVGDAPPVQVRHRRRPSPPTGVSTRRSLPAGGAGGPQPELYMTDGSPKSSEASSAREPIQHDELSGGSVSYVSPDASVAEHPLPCPRSSYSAALRLLLPAPDLRLEACHRSAWRSAPRPSPACAPSPLERRRRLPRLRSRGAPSSPAFDRRASLGPPPRARGTPYVAHHLQPFRRGDPEVLSPRRPPPPPQGLVSASPASRVVPAGAASRPPRGDDRDDFARVGGVAAAKVHRVARRRAGRRRCARRVVRRRFGVGRGANVLGGDVGRARRRRLGVWRTLVAARRRRRPGSRGCGRRGARRAATASAGGRRPRRRVGVLARRAVDGGVERREMSSPIRGQARARAGARRAGVRLARERSTPSSSSARLDVELPRSPTRRGTLRRRARAAPCTPRGWRPSPRRSGGVVRHRARAKGATGRV